MDTATGTIRFCMMNCHYIRYPLTSYLEIAAGYGFKYLELFGAMPHFFLDDVNGDMISGVRSECMRLGLEIVGFTPAQGVYPMSVSIDEERARTRTVTLLKKGIETAEKLGARSMLVSPGFGYQTQSRDYVWGLCRDSFAELADHASRHNVILTVEPLTPMTSNVINTSAQSARMIAEVNSPFLKSMMDIGVMNFMGETVDQYFDNLGDNLYHIHFTDGPGAHVALGDGSFPMADYAKQIEANGYQGFCSFEINDKRYLGCPDQATEKNLAWLKEHNYSL